MVGTTLSHYKIIEKIGEGGMGEVYRAEDTNLSREVAIKVLPEQFTQDPQRLVNYGLTFTGRSAHHHQRTLLGSLGFRP